MPVLARIAPALPLLCLAGACTAIPVPATSHPVVPEVVRRQLGNGPRRDPGAPSERGRCITALVSAGGCDEGPTQLGLAHYLKHMLFKSTPFRPRGFIECEVEGVAGRMNAGTSLDYTYYHTVRPARRGASVELLADLAQRQAR
jgi:Insulinase (Peptidase family M16)